MSDTSKIDLELSPFAKQLLDDSQSECKRVGGYACSLAHLAIVLCRRQPSATASLGSIERLAALVADPDLTGESRVADFLRSTAVTSTDELDKLIAALGEILSDRGSDSGDAQPNEALPETLASKQRSAWIITLGSYVEPAEISGRDGIVDEIIERIGRLKLPVSPILLGAKGSGRTAVLNALAGRLLAASYEGPLKSTTIFRTSAHALVENDPTRSIRKLASELGEDAILCIDDFEIAAGLSRAGADISFLRTVHSLVAEQSPRIILIMDGTYRFRLSGASSGLDEITEEISIPQLGYAELDGVIANICVELESAHRVTIPASARHLALAAVPSDSGQAHPGVAIARLDRACVRARMLSRNEVIDSDLSDDRKPASGPLMAGGLATALAHRVKGQDSAIKRIAKRLSLTKSGLDLRPNRPDGVFLLVGPTGVGKTELARALAEELLGDENMSVRLDMSEYSQEWSISKIIGPPPGYSGSNDPGSWLTTRVLAQPDAVVLLDEFEKAHPLVWNTLLQVFDEGRLTDSLGRTVDFSRTVFLLTSNLGAQEAAREPVGFSKGTTGTAASDDRFLSSIRSELSPELLNRLDDILIFRNLDLSVITQIAAQIVEGIVTRYRLRGFELTIDPEVVDHLANTGYRPEYGARHLQRNVERLLLEPLIGVEGHQLSCRLVKGGQVDWTAS